MDCCLSGVLFSWERARIVWGELSYAWDHPKDTSHNTSSHPPKQCKHVETSAQEVGKKLWNSFYFPLNTEPSSSWMTSVREVITCFANSVNITSIGNMQRRAQGPQGRNKERHHEGEKRIPSDERGKTTEFWGKKWNHFIESLTPYMYIN